MLTGAAAVLALGMAGLTYALWERIRMLDWTIAHGPPSKAMHWPFTSQIAAAIIMFNALLLTPFVFADFVNRVRRNMPLGAGRLRAYGALGAFEILASIAFAFAVIHQSIWGKFDSGDFIAVALCSVVGAWFASLLLWHVVVQARRAASGIETGRQEQLFPPPAQPGPFVESHQLCNVIMASFSLIILASQLIGSQFAGMTASLALWAALMLLWEPCAKTAGRWLRFYGALVFGGCSIAMAWTMMMAPSAFFTPAQRTRERWAEPLGLVLGSLAGVWITYYRRCHPAHTPARSGRRFHSKAAAAVLVTAVGFALIKTIGSGAVLFSALPFLWVGFREGQAEEKRAYRMSIVVSLLYSVSVPLPKDLLQFLRDALISLAAGTVTIGLLLLMERCRRDRTPTGPSRAN